MTASTLVSCIGCSGWLFERIHVGYTLQPRMEDFAAAVRFFLFSSELKKGTYTETTRKKLDYVSERMALSPVQKVVAGRAECVLDSRHVLFDTFSGTGICSGWLNSSTFAR